MKTLLLQIAVTGLYILAASAIGYWMSRKRRPYGWIKSTVHILLIAAEARPSSLDAAEGRRG